MIICIKLKFKLCAIPKIGELEKAFKRAYLEVVKRLIAQMKSTVILIF